MNSSLINPSILLRDYPRALLENDIYVLILALLERQGLATERQLAERSNQSPAHVNAAILALHRNQLVDVSRESIQINSRGKVLIDRMGLARDIVDDLLDEVNIEETGRSNWAKVLLAYREEAYPQFLACTQSFAAWEVVERAALKSSPQSYDRETASVARLVLLVRNVGDWFFAVNRRERGGKAAASPALTVMAASDLLDAQPSKSSWLVHAYINRLRPSWGTRKETRPLDARNETTLDLLARFDAFQRRVDRTTWQRCWAQTGTWEGDLETLWRWLDSESQGVARGSAELLPESAESIGAVAPSFDLLTALIDADTPDEFARLLGLSEGSALQVLRTLQSRADQLLREPDSSAPDPLRQ